jgi:WD40 repeat protein
MTARLWDLDNLAAQPVVLQGHESAIAAVAFSPDNRWVVTGSWDSAARLWNLNFEQLIELACRAAARDLTQMEWELHMEGKPYSKTCSDYPHMKRDKTK